MDMANRNWSAFDPYSGAIVIVRKAHSPKIRKPLEWRRREHPMQLHKYVEWSKEFSSASSSSVNTFRQATNIFASCSCSLVRIRVGRPWLAPSGEQWSYLFFTSIVEYCCSGTVTVAADVTITHVDADHLRHTMMLHLSPFFAPAWNGLILLFTITAFCGAVVWYSFELKEIGTIRTWSPSIPH